MESTNNTRLDWADQTKALAIWFIVLGHCPQQHTLVLDYIYIFHVAVFFFISGFFERPISQASLRTRIIKSLKGLIIPYLCFNLFALSYCWVSPKLHPELYYNIHGVTIFRNALTGILLMDDCVTPYSFLPNGPLWFLISLFICKLLFFIFLKACQNKNLYIKLLQIIAFAILLILIYKFDFHFASLDSTVLAFPIYLLGFYFKEKELHLQFRNKGVAFMILVFIVSIAMLIIGKHFNGFSEYDSGSYGNSIILFYLESISGILICICPMLAINHKNNLISLIGQNTLTILGLHLSILLIGKFIYAYFLGLNITNLPIIYTLVLSIIAVLVCCPIAIFFKKYLPFLIGKS